MADFSFRPGGGDVRLGLCLRLAAVGLFGVCLVYEWRRWPNGSPLLGPLGFVWYNGPTAGSIAVCVVLAAAVLAFPLRPRSLTGGISVIGSVVWWFAGVLAQGIGC